MEPRVTLDFLHQLGRTFACFMSGGCWAYWRIKGRDVCVVCRKPRRDR